MTDEKWQKVREVFDAALRQPPENRLNYAREACGEDQDVLREIESLFSSLDSSESFLEKPAFNHVADMIDPQTVRFAEGTRFAHYDIVRQIGVGGMGEVYLAQDATLKRPAALKLLPAALSSHKESLDRLKREALSASSLNHPNILTIYEIGTDQGHHFIATEFIDGESLRRHMKGKALKLIDVLDIVIQVASALSSAHAAGIVHRDIKPENLMVRPDGLVKVLDFGLAKPLQQKLPSLDTNEPTKVFVKTEAGAVLGTVSYMSPEQVRGAEHVDERTDIWSLGVTLYELISGYVPFTGETRNDVIAAILRADPPLLNTSIPELPAELDGIVTRALRKDKSERYQTAIDLALDLKDLKQNLEVETRLNRSLEPAPISQGTTDAGKPVKTLHVVAGTDEVAIATSTSSAEYVVNKVRRHKLGALLVLATLVVAIAAFVYYSYFRPSSATINSVAVLPFANTSGDPNMDYLSDGLSESLINSLSQLPSLKVIARGSVFKYKGKEVDPQEVANALGVQAIVTGRVVQRGDQLQVSAELVNVSDKTQMWGEQFNRKATDLLQVQTEISQRIAEQLKLRLTSSEQQQLVKDAKANPQAYELFLKGRFHLAKVTAADWKKAVEYFNQALAIDPNYALAHAELGTAYRVLAANSYLDPKEALPKAEAATKRALELDDGLPEAHLGLAVIKRNTWDWAGAEREFKRTLELNPNFARAHSDYGSYLSSMLRHEQGIAERKRARELDPLSLIRNANVGTAYYFARQYDQAIDWLKRTLELDQNFAAAHLMLANAYAAKGDYTKAIAEYREAIRLGWESTGTQCYLGAALAKAGQRAEAEKILKQLETTKEYVSPAELAMLYAGLGDKEKALVAQERAYAAHDPQLQYLAVDPKFDSLRAEPRFKELIRKVGLPESTP